MTTKLKTYSSAVSTSHFMSQFSVDGALSSGLTLAFDAGFNAVGTTIFTIAATTLTFPASSTSWVYISLDQIAFSSAPTLPGVLYKVVTDGSGVTSIEDHRGASPSNKTLFV